jgi:hypothetical protein
VFLGLQPDLEAWKEADDGSRVVIGAVDDGVDFEQLSVEEFSDDDLPSPPVRWKGSCQGFNCTKKLIGGKNFFQPGRRPRQRGIESPASPSTTTDSPMARCIVEKSDSDVVSFLASPVSLCDMIDRSARVNHCLHEMLITIN